MKKDRYNSPLWPFVARKTPIIWEAEEHAVNEELVRVSSQNCESTKDVEKQVSAYI